MPCSRRRTTAVRNPAKSHCPDRGGARFRSQSGGSGDNALTKTLKVRETALARAEEKIAALMERNGHREADIQVSRSNIEKRVEDLNSALQRERMERAVVEGALEAARKDNSRLQGEVAASKPQMTKRCPREKGRSRPSSRKSRPAERPDSADVVARRGKDAACAYIKGDAHAFDRRAVAGTPCSLSLVRGGRMGPSRW